MKAEVVLQSCSWVLRLIPLQGKEREKEVREMKAISIKQLRAMVELGEEQMALSGKSISGS